LSLRAIARQLGVTAPAIYNYFPRLDDLITRLIADAYNAQADFLAEAAHINASAGSSVQLLQVLLAYRTWALANPVSFSLIYGNPIPGYTAPAEITMPAARRVFAVILDILATVHAQGILDSDLAQHPLPAGLELALPRMNETDRLYPFEVLYAGMAGWYHIHGMIMLELFGHAYGLMNDTSAFYTYEVQRLLRSMGISI
jgi:AcrR family transcriptional regulator